MGWFCKLCLTLSYRLSYRHLDPKLEVSYTVYNIIILPNKIQLHPEYVTEHQYDSGFKPLVSMSRKIGIE